MNYAKHVDAIWSAFSSTLPLELRGEAATLSRAVGLVPIAGIPWSKVFKHEVTLAVPALFADAMPQVAPATVMLATTAHMLAIIDAFAVDRMLDRQATDSPTLRRLLEHVRARRDRAIRELSGEAESPYVAAERDAARAIEHERVLLQNATPASIADYARVSLAKQAVAFPASLALAKAVGWSQRQQRAVEHVLRGIVLGLQFHDDVVDWEDDHRHGGAWAFNLCRGRTQDPAGPETELDRVRPSVYASGVLATMMNLARLRYRGAHRVAKVLGASSLACWTAEQEAIAAELAEREKNSAGYAVRAHLLSNWAMEVIG